MRIKNKIMAPVMAGLMLTFTFFSCVDEIKFGNAFLEKAPGGRTNCFLASGKPS